MAKSGNGIKENGQEITEGILVPNSGGQGGMSPLDYTHKYRIVAAGGNTYGLTDKELRVFREITEYKGDGIPVVDPIKLSRFLAKCK